jgi:hypothetical protein
MFILSTQYAEHSTQLTLLLAPFNRFLSTEGKNGLSWQSRNKRSVTYILKTVGIINHVLESFRSAVGLTEVLFRYEQTGKESLRPSENIKVYLQNTGLITSINCLAFVLIFFLFWLRLIRRALINRFWKPKKKMKWTRNATACCQAYLWIFQQ